MLKQISFILLFLLASAFGSQAFAQTPEEAYDVRNSSLAAIDLPAGAMRVREASIPAEIKTTLAEFIKAGGERVRQGESEVVVWSGKTYKKSDSERLLKQLESNLKKSGWAMEVGERTDEFVLFNLLHNESHRALVGFFVPMDEAFVFAVTEMLPATPATVNAPNQPETQNQSAENPPLKIDN